MLHLFIYLIIYSSIQ